MIFQQTRFDGGIDFLNEPTDIAANAYQLLINARCRNGKPVPIPKPTDYTGDVQGKRQGIYSIGNVLLRFAGGYAYYLVEGQTVWVRIGNFSLSGQADRIWAIAVPESIMNFKRTAVINAITGITDSSAGVVKDGSFQVAGTPSCVLCQDGINQPQIIEYDPVSQTATAREAFTYDDWSNNGNSNIADSREYVPIGQMMCYLESAGILFIVAPDGSTIYRSVSGRPLDFMVNIDSDGNKLATEALGGATTTSFAAGFQNINYIGVSNDIADTLMIGTDLTLYGYSLDYSTTVFGEPTFDRAYVIASGVVNQDSVAAINGDTVFIDFESFRTFNGVEQQKIEGTNDPFSLPISGLFYNKKTLKNLRQTNCCIGRLNDYYYFACQSIYGNVIMIYDSVRQIWVCADKNDATIAPVIMFASTTTDSQSWLYSLSDDGSVYKLESNPTNRETAILFTGEWVVQGDLKSEHKTDTVNVSFKPGTYVDGTVRATVIVDGQEDSGGFLTKDQEAQVCNIQYPVGPPVGPRDGTYRVRNMTFDFRDGRRGQRIGCVISWNGDATLQALQLNSTSTAQTQSGKEQERVFQK